MSHKSRQRLIAVIALTAIFLFAYAAVNHWHSTARSQEHCQVCHLAHSLWTGVSAGAVLVAPVLVSHPVLSSRRNPTLDLQDRHVSSRAPPFASQLS